MVKKIKIQVYTTKFSMSWSSFETSPNAKFGSSSGLLGLNSDIYTSLYVDVLGSWGVELWFYKENTGPCVLVCSDVPAFHLLLNRRGRYVLRLSGYYHGGESCEVSRVTGRNVKNSEWNHVCIQYHKERREYTLYSNGLRLLNHKGSTVSPSAFDRVRLGSSGIMVSSLHPRFYGSMDSFRVSSCVRYRGESYRVPEEAFSPDAFTTTINDFEEPVFVVPTDVVQTERNWYNTTLSKTNRFFMTGTQSLVVDDDTTFFPGLRTPGVDMNSVSWIVEFFFRVNHKSEGDHIVIKRGVLFVVLSGDSIKVVRKSRTICTMKSSVVFGEWNHLFLCHDSEKHSLYMGSNGTKKKAKGYPRIEPDHDIEIGSIDSTGSEPMYYDCFRMSIVEQGTTYGKKYEVPCPLKDQWSCLDPRTVMYTSFEEPVFTASNITSFSVLLSWKPIEPIGHKKSSRYTVYINGSMSRNETSGSSHNVYGLEEDTEYILSIYYEGEMIHHSIPVKTLKASRDNSFNVLSSISTGGKYDVSKLPSKMVRGMDMGSVFDSMDRVILPIPRSGVQKSKVVANFAGVSSVVDTSSSKALLVPFNKPGQKIGLRDDEGTTTDVVFVEGGVEIDGSRVEPGGYVVVSGRKMRVTQL